jgi:hypothetical protein
MQRVALPAPVAELYRAIEKLHSIYGRPQVPSMATCSVPLAKSLRKRRSALSSSRCQRALTTLDCSRGPSR